jgi:RNA polymerase sigma factor for flagellar operon FliA
MTDVSEYKNFKPGSEELVHHLVEENAGWAASIARSVARAWNMDWQLDGLDGGAYEALLFCARRFDPTMGVPFRAYARRRIHESSTEEARKSKAWQRGTGGGSPEEITAREISAKLFELFPELREGILPAADDSAGDGVRSSIRQLLASASVLASFQEGNIATPETVAQYKQILEVIAELELVHQSIVWAIYWNGQSMRALAETWEIDELAIIREHKEILQFVFGRLSTRSKTVKKLKIRPGLRTVAQELRKNKTPAPFARFLTGGVGIALLIVAMRFYTVLEQYAGSLLSGEKLG